jgi:hypothetical protein
LTLEQEIFERKRLASRDEAPAGLGWLTGDWVGRNGDDTVKEHFGLGWSAGRKRERAHEFVLVQLRGEEAVFLEGDRPAALGDLSARGPGSPPVLLRERAGAGHRQRHVRVRAIPAAS